MSYTTNSLNLYEAGAIAVAFAGMLWLALAARRRPRLPQLCFLTLALFLVLNKVYSPQYVLWLLPFAVLARPRWRAFIVWQAAEIIYFLGIWMYLLGDPSGRSGKGLEFGGYAVALSLRDLAVLGLCVLVSSTSCVPNTTSCGRMAVTIRPAGCSMARRHLRSRTGSVRRAGAGLMSGLLG